VRHERRGGVVRLEDGGARVTPSFLLICGSYALAAVVLAVVVVWCFWDGGRRG